MKDQGKISELNTSSHRYQSSRTEGQQSENHGTLAFVASTNKNHGYESHLLSKTPNNSVRDFRLMEFETSKPDLRNSMVNKNDISINFDVFPNASPIDTIMELAKKEPTQVLISSQEYAPQSGEIPPTGIAAFQTVATKCVGELTHASALSFTFYKNKLTELLPSHGQGYDIVFIMSAFILAYICYRIVADLILSLVWGCGFITAKMLGNLQKHKQQQSFLDQLLTPQSSARRLRKIRKFRDMAPQAGTLNSDDGAAFLGIKTSNKVKSPKKNPPKQTASSAQPIQETIPWSGQAAFGGPPRPKRDQTQYNGPLNGFGVGI